MNYMVTLKRGLLLFWSGWLSTVFASNLADALLQAGLIPQSWRFVSGNFAMVQETIAIYSLSKFWASLLFGAVLLIQFAASLLFWRAFLSRESVIIPGHPKVVLPFLVAVGLFAGFLLADEVFIIYHRRSGMETTHFLILGTLLLSLLVITSLKNGEQAR